ncbi:MAG: hypothetical protein V4801_28065 [Burkholderia gladioli]
MFLKQVTHSLHDCKCAHQQIYETEIYDGNAWISHGQMVVLEDAVACNGVPAHQIDYSGSTHALVVRGGIGAQRYTARLNLTECGSAFVGTLVDAGGTISALRGTALSSVFDTQRHLKAEPNAPFVAWDTFSIKTEWVDSELKVTYLLGRTDVSDRVRVTSIDRQKGQTTLEMVPQFDPPGPQDSFVITLMSGNRVFQGEYTSGDDEVYTWTGASTPALAEQRASVFATVVDSAAALAAANVTAAATVAVPLETAATLTLQDLDNISSLQVVVDKDGNKQTVDFAQITCGNYFNKCLVNGLESKWIDGIYGHAYTLPTGVNQVFNKRKTFFQGKAVLGTGQMLYDNLGANKTYEGLIKRMKDDAMQASWKALGDVGKDNKDESIAYQEASNDLYIEGYRDGVPLMKPFLLDNPKKWAADYFAWLTDEANLLTWSIQVASKMFDNVRQRMYEWYVKLQVLDPDNNYGERFMTIAYAALLGVNYSKSRWSDDLKPFLESLIEQAIAGKVDKEIMDEVQRRAAEANQELLKTLITTTDTIHNLVNGISAGITAWQLKNGIRPLSQIAEDPELHALIGQNLEGTQYQAWSDLSRRGKAGGVFSTLMYGATAGFLIYSIVDSASKPLTPKQIIQDINLGLLALASLVKGVQRMMSLGVGRFLENFSRAAEGGAFRAFAGDIATWFKQGGKIVPEGKMGKLFVTVFGESSAEFLARRVGPALAVVGLVLSSFMLVDAIKSGKVRDIVFEALNTFFALADLVFIGLELFSFAWAGPVGIGVAVVGVIILLVQFIWNLIDPPTPAPDPITDFVNGPMVEKGFAAAA